MPSSRRRWAGRLGRQQTQRKLAGRGFGARASRARNHKPLPGGLCTARRPHNVGHQQALPPPAGRAVRRGCTQPGGNPKASRRAQRPERDPSLTHPPSLHRPAPARCPPLAPASSPPAQPSPAAADMDSVTAQCAKAPGEARPCKAGSRAVTNPERRGAAPSQPIPGGDPAPMSRGRRPRGLQLPEPAP